MLYNEFFREGFILPGNSIIEEGPNRESDIELKKFTWYEKMNSTDDRHSTIRLPYGAAETRGHRFALYRDIASGYQYSCATVCRAVQCIEGALKQEILCPHLLHLLRIEKEFYRPVI